MVHVSPDTTPLLFYNELPSVVTIQWICTVTATLAILSSGPADPCGTRSEKHATSVIILLFVQKSNGQWGWFKWKPFTLLLVNMVCCRWLHGYVYHTLVGHDGRTHCNSITWLIPTFWVQNTTKQHQLGHLGPWNHNKPGVHKSQETKFCMVTAKIPGSSVWNLIHLTFLAPRILMWLLDFWKICTPLVETITHVRLMWHDRASNWVPVRRREKGRPQRRWKDNEQQVGAGTAN
jgi:hypothetical protein